MDISQLRHTCIALAFAILLGAVAALGGQRAIPAGAVTMQNDFAGLVDIGGGRHLYLECHGQGSPTVVLEAGYRASARFWSDDLLHPDAPRPMVLPGVAAFSRVCAYDRPGTTAFIGDDLLVSRSDPLAQPRTATEIVADLHALLEAADVPGPYVLAGHSLGGLFVRLYASTYPEEVAGLVLIDPFTEFIEQLLTPAQWQALVQLNVASGTDTVLPIPDYGDLETVGYASSNSVMRQATAANPLHPMPLVAIARERAFDLTEAALGFPPAVAEAAFRASTVHLTTLVPNARLIVAEESGHDVHQDQPELVTEAIRQVVAGVRNPDTWYNLASCCAAATPTTAPGTPALKPIDQAALQAAVDTAARQMLVPGAMVLLRTPRASSPPATAPPNWTLQSHPASTPISGSPQRPRR